MREAPGDARRDAASHSRNRLLRKCINSRVPAGPIADPIRSDHRTPATGEAGGTDASRPQVPVEEFRRRVVGREPMVVRQEIVNLVGKNDLLKVHVLFPQRFNKLNHVGE